MGFLDMFDDPNVMGSLLGVPVPSAVVPPPQPPQSAPPLPPPQSVGPAPGGAPQVPMPQPRPDSAPQLPMPQPNPLGAGAPSLGGGPGAPDMSGGGPGGGVSPLPGAAPDAGPAVAPPLPPPQSIGYAPGAGPQVPTPLGAPASTPGGVPPMPPAAAQGSGPPSSFSGGGLAGALGLTPNTIRAMAAGVGKGLSAVGRLPFGATAGQAFAAGAGGALSGSVDAEEKLKQNLFNQSSSAFKDMVAAKNADDSTAYRNAQAQYLRARAQSLMTGGTANGSRAWQNTPYGKTIEVENQAQKYEKGQQILLQKRWQTNGSSPDDQQKDLDQLNKNVEAYRRRLYQQVGIDPNQAGKLRDMGTTKVNPFDTKGMTLDQFHQTVPMGAWFKDQNGVVRQRTVPPPGLAPSPGSNAANYDDQTAMIPAA